MLAGLHKYYCADFLDRKEEMDLCPTQIPLNFEISPGCHIYTKHIKDQGFPIYLL